MKWNKIFIPHPCGGHDPIKLIVAERVQAFSKPELEAEAEAIFTVGRLIRERNIFAFTSMELKWEGLRDEFRHKPLDVLQNCPIDIVPNPIERGRFIQSELGRFIKKGGKKDLCGGKDGSSQIYFFNWLRSLHPDIVAKLINQKQERRLTDFDCEGFRDLDWFKELASRLRSDENLPDAFYLWTVRRNNLDVFLTLDFRLINQVASIERDRSGFRLGFRVQSPIQFLHDKGIERPDQYPCVVGRQYTMAEIASISQILNLV